MASCQSNLRQIGLGSMMYSSDWQDWLVPSFVPGGNTFVNMLNPYLPMGSWPAPRKPIYSCPSHAVAFTDQFPLTYAANESAHSKYDPTSTQTCNLYLHRADAVRRPSEVISIADCSQSSGAGTCAGFLDWSGCGSEVATPGLADAPTFIMSGWDNTDVGNYHVRFRHAGNVAANAVCIDGHVETFVWGKLRIRHLSTAF